MAKINQKIKKIARRGRPKRQPEAEIVENVSQETLIENDTNEEPLISDSIDEKLESNPEILSDLTLEELANIAIRYSNRSIETLKRLKREELIYIITQQKDDYKVKEYASIGNDTKDLIELLIEVLSDIKHKREGKPLNAILLKVLRKQDKKIAEGLVKAGASGGMLGYSLCICVIILVFIDALLGFDKLVNLFVKKDKTIKNNENQSNNNNN